MIMIAMRVDATNICSKWGFTCRMVVAPSAPILNHLRVPTAASCALRAGNCRGTWIGICKGLLGLCMLCSPCLTKSSCDIDFRMFATAKAGEALVLTCSGTVSFLLPVALLTLAVPVLLRLNLGCFLAVELLFERLALATG